ncbi:MAG: hypothetical protein ABSG79_23845 [Bryobacteraceae bacterium]
MIQIMPQMRILVAIEAVDGRKGIDSLSKGRFTWWPAGQEPARRLQAHQAQLLLAAGNPEIAAAPVWRKVS